MLEYGASILDRLRQSVCRQLLLCAAQGMMQVQRARLSLIHSSFRHSSPCGLIVTRRSVTHDLRPLTMGPKVKISYLVHDLSDPAVHRRTRMLKAGGACVRLAGFRRTAQHVERVEDCETIDLGETRDGALLARIASVASVAIRLKRLESVMRGSQVVLARNLEMLFLATKARRRYAPDAALVYECLDIHRLLLGRSLPSQLLQSIEHDLMREVDLVLTSSPRFITEYFSFRKFDPPIKLFENKPLLLDFGMARQPSLPSGPPWKLGWFGMIRCRRSFAILSAVARELGGNLQIRIAGRASPKEFPDFEKLVARSPHVTFTGSYGFEELPDLYGGVHFSWAIDFFEQGLNSSWLLPNRIYESSLFGAIPIAEEGVETARWLTEKGIGVILSGDPKTSLLSFLSGLTSRRYRQLARALQKIPTAELAMTEESCSEILKEFGAASDSVRGRL